MVLTAARTPPGVCEVFVTVAMGDRGAGSRGGDEAGFEGGSTAGASASASASGPWFAGVNLGLPARVLADAAVAGLRASSLRAWGLPADLAADLGRCPSAFSSPGRSAAPGLRQGALRADLRRPGVRNSGAVATGAMSDFPVLCPEAAPAAGGELAPARRVGVRRIIAPAGTSRSLGETPKTVAPADRGLGARGSARACSFADSRETFARCARTCRRAREEGGGRAGCNALARVGDSETVKGELKNTKTRARHVMTVARATLSNLRRIVVGEKPRRAASQEKPNFFF